MRFHNDFALFNIEIMIVGLFIGCLCWWFEYQLRISVQDELKREIENSKFYQEQFFKNNDHVENKEE